MKPERLCSQESCTKEMLKEVLHTEKETAAGGHSDLHQGAKSNSNDDYTREQRVGWERLSEANSRVVGWFLCHLASSLLGTRDPLPGGSPQAALTIHSLCYSGGGGNPSKAPPKQMSPGCWATALLPCRQAPQFYPRGTHSGEGETDVPQKSRPSCPQTLELSYWRSQGRRAGSRTETSLQAWWSQRLPHGPERIFTFCPQLWAFARFQDSRQYCTAYAIGRAEKARDTVSLHKICTANVRGSVVKGDSGLVDRVQALRSE